MMSIWANPSEVLENDERIPELAQALGVDAGGLKAQLAQRSEREFVYLRRPMAPAAARAVLDLGIPGINGQREFKRYYPAGEVTAHALGCTNIDDRRKEWLVRSEEPRVGKEGSREY